MQNVKTKIDKDTLTITIDLNESFGSSKSGKTTIIATTGGNVSLGHASGAVLGLNVYKPKTF